jgi:hypothetical protein
VYPRAKALPRTAGACSREGTELAQDASALLVAALDTAGLRQADLAAIWNCSEGRVRAKLDATNDGAPITLRDVLKLRKRAPAMWAAVLAALVAMDVGQ